MHKPFSYVIRSAGLCLLSTLLMSTPSWATLITFDNITAGTTITNQYLAQGISFSQGIVAKLPDGNNILQVSNPETPQMNLFFSSPIYSFSSSVIEFYYETEPVPYEDPLPDGPPADDAKPDASVYPTLHFADGSTAALETIHTLNNWHTLNFDSTKPVTSLQLDGHYEGTPPIYFALDAVTFSNSVATPEPASALLLLTGLPWAIRLRKKHY